jgi:23S rRNA (adenine-N6)-dimethyltransferase
VVAVEKDGALAARLARRFVENPVVSIVQADFLDVSLPREPFTVFASLPFNATSEIVTRLLGAASPPDELHLVVQREAAERYTGRPRESLVAVLLKPWPAPRSACGSSSNASLRSTERACAGPAARPRAG